MNSNNTRILLTGSNGFLGQYVHKELQHQGVEISNIVIPRSITHDLRKLTICEELVKNIDVVIHLAAKVGGIGFNKENPAMLYYDNIIMGTHLIDSAYRAGVKKFVCLGTICAYPKFTPVPFQEQSLWDGYPEETNAPYGLAKKMLLVQLQAYRQQYGFNGIYLLPVNLYGPGDNFNPESSHVIPALIKKCIDAIKNKTDQIVIWGDGTASREFVYAQDCAEAIVAATLKYEKGEPVNIGSGQEISIKDLVNIIVELTGFSGKIIWDTSKPNGQPRRCLDTSRAKNEFGFVARTSLKDGLRATIEWYKKNLA